MSETNRKTVFCILDVAFSIGTVLLAVLLMVQCAEIYRAGIDPSNRTASGVLIQDIYSRDRIAARISDIRWAIGLWLALFLAELLARTVHPKEKERMAALPVENRLWLMHQRVVPTAEMQLETRKRRMAAILCGVVCLVSAGMTALYLCNPAHFASRDLETVVGTMLRHIAPWIVLAFGTILAFEGYRHRSMLRELEAIKRAPKCESAPRAASPRANVLVLQLGLVVAAAGLILAGIYNGGMRDVLVKAINICTECIGLG